MDLSSAGAIVLETLGRACSQDANILKPAEAQLKEWDAQPGFYTILLSVFSDHSIEVNVRWLAVLYFKNGIERYWRKTAPRAISEEEKTAIKQKLISSFNEPVNQVAVQIAVLISKIARVDCPKHWEELVPTLLEGLKCPDELVQQRVLLTFHHVTRTLASKRLPLDRKYFCELTSNTFAFILSLWTGHSDSVFQAVRTGDVKRIQLAMEYSLLSLKVLRKMIVFGFQDLHTSTEAASFLNTIFQRITEFLEIKSSLQQDYRALEMREKILILLIKVLIETQEMHPDSYVPFLSTSLDICVRYNFTEDGKGKVFERFTVGCFNLIKNILRSENYRPAKVLEETTSPVTLEASKIKMAFFTHSNMSEICQRLVKSYLPLTPEDLECWDSDPEDFVADEGGDSWKFSLRPATEVLFLTLFKEFRLSLVPVLLNMVREAEKLVDTQTDLTTLLYKDAVYNAVGLSSFDLYDDIDFDQWFTNTLLSELQNSNSELIRRRVIWLIGQWVGVKLSIGLRPALYEALLPLLGHGEDLVVRIEAANTLKTAVDDFEFNTEQFEPYLETSFKLLFQLLTEVSSCESKMLVLNVMSFVIERSGANIRPHASNLLQYLPLLWQESEEHNMLRCAILTTLTHLVQGLGEISLTMYEFLLPVIQLSTDINQQAHVYLLEDGLELWDVTLCNTPRLTPELLRLFINLPPLLEYGTENLQVCLKLIESYVVLGQKQFMEEYSSILVPSLCSVLTDLKTEGVIMVLKVVDLIFKVFPVEGPQVFRPLLPTIYMACLTGEEQTYVQSVYMCLLSRIIVQNNRLFWVFLDEYARSNQRDSNQLLDDMLHVTFDKLDCIAQQEWRKMVAMAMATFIPNSNGVVVQNFGEIINVCVQVLHDVMNKEHASEQYTDSLVFVVDQADCDEEVDTEHEKRKRQLTYQDPVHSTSLRDFVVGQLGELGRQCGMETLHQRMQSVDMDVSSQLQWFLR